MALTPGSHSESLETLPNSRGSLSDSQGALSDTPGTLPDSRNSLSDSRGAFSVLVPLAAQSPAAQSLLRKNYIPVGWVRPG